jgi:hypothetical protein
VFTVAVDFCIFASGVQGAAGPSDFLFAHAAILSFLES